MIDFQIVKLSLAEIFFKTMQADVKTSLFFDAIAMRLSSRDAHPLPKP